MHGCNNIQAFYITILYASPCHYLPIPILAWFAPGFEGISTLPLSRLTLPVLSFCNPVGGRRLCSLGISPAQACCRFITGTRAFADTLLFKLPNIAQGFNNSMFSFKIFIYDFAPFSFLRRIRRFGSPAGTTGREDLHQQLYLWWWFCLNVSMAWSRAIVDIGWIINTRLWHRRGSSLWKWIINCCFSFGDYGCVPFSF